MGKEIYAILNNHFEDTIAKWKFTKYVKETVNRTSERRATADLTQ